MRRSRPGVNDPAIANADAGGLGAQLFHDADDLVAERARRAHRSQEIRLAPVAEIEIAFAEMQVGVADAAGFHPQQHLRAGGGGGDSITSVSGAPNWVSL